MNQRSVALTILHKTIKDESYSNLLMRQELNKLEPIHRSLVTELVYGVLRNYDNLLYQFKDELDDKTSLKNKLIICLALYERFYLKEKDYVTNNEYVNLAESKYDKSFINAILHKIKEYKVSEEPHIRYSLPKWLYKLLESQYSPQELEKILNVYQKAPKLYYRINKNKVTFKNFRDIDIVNDDLFLSKNNLLNSAEYKRGYFYVQDYNSASLYKHLDLNPDCTLLDVCSAPGSKLFNCLDVVKQENAYGNDIHEHRVELIRKAALRLGYDKINLLNFDGLKLKDNLNMQFDRILLDAPCSGLGVISRKPDLKFHVKPESLDELQKLQYDLLVSLKDLLKNKGILLYSTCTLNKKENGKLISKFIKENSEFKVLEEETIINDLGDCFYYCKLEKDI